ASIKDPQIQYQKKIGGKNETLRVTSAFGTGNTAEGALEKDFPDAKFTRAALDKVGPVIGAEIEKAAVIASLLSLFGILIYVAVRYEFSFAVGAVLAVFHDVFMTIGIYCLSGRQLHTTTVAAILTINGF